MLKQPANLETPSKKENAAKGEKSGDFGIKSAALLGFGFKHSKRHTIRYALTYTILYAVF